MYDEDLAHIHDAGFTEFTRRCAPEVLAILADAGIDGGTVVDLGCGGGFLLAELTRAGYDAVGVAGAASTATGAAGARRMPIDR